MSRRWWRTADSVSRRAASSLVLTFWTPLLLLWSQRLPQFDLVAVRIVDPREAAIVCVLALGIDLDAFFLQTFKQRIQVVHDVVHHERGLAGLEVLGVLREHGPDRHMLLVGVLFF